MRSTSNATVRRAAADASAFGRGVLRVAGAFRRYHRHHVRGLQHLQEALGSGRPVILAGNHCMDVVDPLMLVTAIRRDLGRAIPAIGHRTIFFGLPGVRSLVRASGVIPSGDAALAEKILRREGALLVYPGAGQEAALRSYRREPYTLKW
ncbi:MAG: 1-acyl-sn-glycerol-3-phosphate acyltransferase [Candidatus Binatia bacterium]